jgi:hypothetical protein
MRYTSTPACPTPERSFLLLLTLLRGPMALLLLLLLLLLCLLPAVKQVQQRVCLSPQTSSGSSSLCVCCVLPSAGFVPLQNSYNSTA